MRLFLMVSAVLLMGGSLAGAQVVHRDEIENFTGVLEVEKTGAQWDDWGLSCSEFVSWSTDPGAWTIRSAKTYRREHPGRFMGCVESLIDEPQPLRNTDLVIIALNDKFGHERQFRVLTFWEGKGDSLYMRRIVPGVHVGRLGGLRVVDLLVRRDGTAIVVIENYTSGEGDHIGKYEFLLLNTDTLRTEFMYADSFNYEYGGQCDTLSFHLFENEKGVLLELYREEITFELSDTEPRQFERVTVTADTTSFQLMVNVEGVSRINRRPGF